MNDLLAFMMIKLLAKVFSGGVALHERLLPLLSFYGKILFTISVLVDKLSVNDPSHLEVKGIVRRQLKPFYSSDAPGLSCIP